MTLKEATVYQEAICAGLHETGKDSPYRDDMIPKMKESCELAIRSLEAWEKVKSTISRNRSRILDGIEIEDIDARIIDEAWAGAYKSALDIINKHLPELEEQDE